MIYSRNIARWKKLANSLRLRIALRIADKDAAKSKSVLDEIKADGNLFISDDTDNKHMGKYRFNQEDSCSVYLSGYRTIIKWYKI
ncbi:hypothetical protein GCM10008119_13020 [Pedobacter mendelii]|uniref:Uncharacterized protein n=1 Tax=Pedobacter mendelii TaxID=1908240 RepID=A0ABQ2BHL8_9SPHI|nr:hypothetical protein GCM10008119_13020 [Pedobacter mendelii]